MVENINSKYILNIIISYANEKTKLNLVKYNKVLQNQMNISLINYKILSGSYIIFGKNGTGKEYSFYENKLRFEGGYLNGKRNGKGKEYDYDNKYIVFEGDYVNGEKHGKGKEYFKNGVIKFEGEYFRGKKWNGKGYNMNKELIYELNNGNGYVKEYNDYGKLEYEGEYLNGKRWNGKEYNINGNIEFQIKRKIIC